jgi:alkylhydroperoxidase family enzyme
VLPTIYPEAEIAKAVGEDPSTAAIPEMHKAMFAMAERFVKNSWTSTADDIQYLRDLDVSDRDISEWLQIACIQTWFTNSADAGGIPLEGNAITGPVMHRERAFYHDAAPANGVEISSSEADAVTQACATGWLSAPCEGDSFASCTAWGDERYGFVPNLLQGLSACPDFYSRHQLALELLEEPQSGSLSKSLHALVRARVNAMNNSHYFMPTAQAMLDRNSPGVMVSDLGADSFSADDSKNQVVLDFVAKMVRNSYKITADDAQRFRDAGFDDESYIDVFNTVAIQTSMDRLANSIGVSADDRPLLAGSK